MTTGLETYKPSIERTKQLVEILALMKTYIPKISVPIDNTDEDLIKLKIWHNTLKDCDLDLGLQALQRLFNSKRDIEDLKDTPLLTLKRIIEDEQKLKETFIKTYQDLQNYNKKYLKGA